MYNVYVRGKRGRGYSPNIRREFLPHTEVMKRRVGASAMRGQRSHPARGNPALTPVKVMELALNMADL